MDIRSKFLQALGVRRGGGEEKPATERTIALEQIWSQVNKAINERDPDDWNQWHWVQDLYYDEGQLFAITISAGRLYRWPVTVDGDAVTVGDPVAVVVEFSSADDGTIDDGTMRHGPSSYGLSSTVRQTHDGRWVGCSVLCTATVNKMGILDSRSLFDSFVERFKGDGSEYVNLLHLGGDKSQVGVLRHIWREDKLLVGLYEFTQGDPVAEAVARTLATDADGFWGGSIEFDHFGKPQLVEVSEGVKLPMTHDGQLLGYSIARNQDCAAWYTGNIVTEQRTMTERDKEIAKELLGDDALVDELQERIGEANRALAGAVTRTVQQQHREHGEGTESTEREERLETGDLETGDQEDAEPVTYELDAEAIEQITGQVVNHRGITDRFAAVSVAFEQRVSEALGRVDALAADLEARAAALGERLAKLESEEQARYRQYDAEKPKQPAGTIKVGVRPAGRGNAVPDVQNESAFARKAREQRERRG